MTTGLAFEMLTGPAGVVEIPLIPVLDESAYWAPDNNPNLPPVPNLDGGTEDAALISAIPLYNICGLTWAPATGSTSVQCQVRYRPVGEMTWRHGHDGRYDDFTRSADQPPEEYRTMLFFLKAGTLYEFRLKLANGQYREGNFTTWTEVADLPIGTITGLPATSSATLTLTSADSGTAEAWNVWEPSGVSAEIDVADAERYCIKTTDCKFFIIRGDIKLKGASINGVYLTGDTIDWVLSGLNISEFGSLNGAFAQSRDAGISNEDVDLSERHTAVGRGTIERCTIHDPRHDASHWDEPVKDTHPEGAQPVWLANCDLGQLVIRYNDFRGSGDGGGPSVATKVYNDGIGGLQNFSNKGFPVRNSDIHTNILREAADDMVECEGRNLNVAVRSNYIDEFFEAVGASPVHAGPFWFIKNIVDRTIRYEGDPFGGTNGGGMAKVVGIKALYGGGASFWYHNTLLQSGGEDWGVKRAIRDVGQDPPYNLKTRNNIFETRQAAAFSTIPDDGTRGNDFDFDLCNGSFGDTYTGAEPNGIIGSPTYLNGNPAHGGATPNGDYELDPASLGYNAGEFIPGISLNINGANPDMGAHEKGRAVMQFGPTAFL